jgi:hypothetical protein
MPGFCTLFAVLAAAVVLLAAAATSTAAARLPSATIHDPSYSGQIERAPTFTDASADMKRQMARLDNFLYKKQQASYGTAPGSSTVDRWKNDAVTIGISQTKLKSIATRKLTQLLPETSTTEEGYDDEVDEFVDVFTTTGAIIDEVMAPYQYPLEPAMDSEGLYPYYEIPPLNMSTNLGKLLRKLNEVTAEHSIYYAVAFCSDYSLAPAYVQEGACCVINSYKAAILGCTVLIVRDYENLSSEALQQWTGQLPSGLKVLSMSGRKLQGSLPSSFGNASSTLELLDFDRNKFSGQMPPEWDKSLSALKSVTLLENNFTDPVRLPILSSQWHISMGATILIEVEKVERPKGVIPDGWLLYADNITWVPLNETVPGLDYLFVNLPAAAKSGYKGHVVRPLNLTLELGKLWVSEHVLMSGNVVFSNAAKACSVSHINEGACCVVDSAEAVLDGCAVVGVEFIPENMQEWANTRLPLGLQGL